MNIFPQCILVYFATAIYKSNSLTILFQKKEDNGEILWKIVDHNAQKESKTATKRKVINDVWLLLPAQITEYKKLTQKIDIFVENIFSIIFKIPFV